MEKKITFYLADDHQIILDGLMLLIESEPSWEIIGTANEGNKAYHEILLNKPDIALIDLRMPNRNGIQLILSLTKLVPTKFIILSMHDDKHYITDAKNIGAFGYLLKNVGKDELLKCINMVIKNEQYYPYKNVLSLFDKPYRLTPRELEILKLIVNEYTSQQIANQLSLSHFTVETHRKNIWKKTNAKTIVGLIKFAIENEIEYE
jgi:two-component system nitrate/nitrite response regulator NarL